MSAVRIQNPSYILRVTPRSPGKHDNIIISLGGVKDYKFQEGNDLIFAYNDHARATAIKQKLNKLKYVQTASLQKRNPKHKKHRNINLNPFISDKSIDDLETLTSKIKINSIKSITNPVAHFPRTGRGRPRKHAGPGRPTKFKKVGKSVFSEQEKTRRARKKRGRPIRNDYWILDCYVKGILIATYIGEGAKSTALREASDMLNKPLQTEGKIIDSVGIIDKVELAGPYPREDGKPTPAWPRL